MFTIPTFFLQVLDGLNSYNILEPCFHRGEAKDVINENSTSFIPESFKQLGVTERPLAVRKRIFGRAWPFRAPVAEGIIPLWPQLMREIIVPCIVRIKFDSNKNKVVYVTFLFCAG